MPEERREAEPKATLSGVLDILGLRIDLGELLTSPETLVDRLEELRERLKQAGGKETLSDEEWRQGGARVSGYIRTRGPQGEQEYHVGTTGRPPRRPRAAKAPQAPEAVEPPVDLFEEGEDSTIVADVPGVEMEDLELKAAGGVFSLSTKPMARRHYAKELHLSGEVEPGSLQATCRNGVLEVRLRRRAR